VRVHAVLRLSPQAKYCKNGLKGYTPFGQIIQKIPILAIVGAILPHFLTDSDKILHEGATLGRPPQAKFYKYRLRGYTLFGQIYTKNYKFLQFLRCSPHFKNENS